MEKKVKSPVLYLVVPCFNEEEVITKTSRVLLNKIEELVKKKTIASSSKIVFVNDGSKDKTEEIITALTKKNNKYGLINFTANYGHQSAIYAGMMLAKDYADIVVTIDADLQQDINALEEFIGAYKNGADVVFGIRNDRKSDNFIKKTTATLYYKFMKLLGCNILPNSADYRLLSKKAVELLSQYKESNLFLRGLIPSMGLKSDIVYFDVKEREAGSSKYTFSKMFNLAINGITSFSVKPLHYICITGFLFLIASFVLIVVTLIEWIQGKNVLGYTTLLIVLLVSVGLIMLSLGIIGEYIGNIYTEVKQRPRYIIDSVKLNNKEDRK